MKWSKGLILASAASYIAATCAAYMGYPPLANYGSTDQSAIYGVMVLLLSLQFVDKLPFFGKLSLVVMYGFLAMFSFSGIQEWINYSGTASLGPWMALWDLSLAVAIADDL